MWRDGTQLSVHWGQYCIRKQLWNQLLREFPQIALHLYETNGEQCSLGAGSVYVVHRGQILQDIHFFICWKACVVFVSRDLLNKETYQWVFLSRVVRFALYCVGGFFCCLSTSHFLSRNIYFWHILCQHYHTLFYHITFSLTLQKQFTCMYNDKQNHSIKPLHRTPLSNHSSATITEAWQLCQGMNFYCYWNWTAQPLCSIFPLWWS